MRTAFRDFDDTLRTMDFLRHRFDRMFDAWAVADLAGDSPARPATTAWPPAYGSETNDAFVVKAEVPGVAESDLAVSVEEGALVLRGARRADVPEGYIVLRRERAPIAFTRTLPLPAHVDADGVSAVLRDGVLTVTLPKAKDALPRVIPVKAG